MRNVAISVLLLCGAVAVFADYTPMSKEDTDNAVTFSSSEINGDVTLANDETIDNATDSTVQVTYNDDAVVLGTLKLESENAAASMADGDELRVDYAAQNDATQEVTYARVIVDLDDISDSTEDGAYEIWVMKAGTLTQTVTVDANGASFNDLNIVNVGDIACDTVSEDGTGGVAIEGITINDGAITWTNTFSIVIDGTTAVTTNQTFLSATDVTNTLVIVDGLIKAIQ